MNLRAALFSILILFALQVSHAQDHAWRLRHSGIVASGAGINPLNTNTVFAALFGGNDTLIVSYNKGVTWTTQAIGSYFGGILVHPADTLVMFALATAGMIRSSDYGLSWTTVLTAPPNVVSVVIDPIHPDTMYAGTLGGSVYRSTDRGITWEIISYVGDDLCTLAIRPDSINILYAGWAGKISKSTDGGFSWRLIVTTGADDIPFVFVDFHNPLVAYATAHKGYYGVWKTIDGGENWNATTPPNFSYWAMDVDRSNPAIVYVGESPGNVISRSTDEGVSWETLGQGLFEVDDITVHPVDGDLWVGSFSGLYRWVPLLATVGGMVLDDETGEPVTGGYVEVPSSGERVSLDTTGGSFTLHYYDGDPMVIRVAAFPYYVKDEPVELDDSVVTHNVLTTRLPLSSISGTIEDSLTHAPVVAEVTLSVSSSLGDTTRSLVTGPDGSFLFDSLFISQPPVISYSDITINPAFPYASVKFGPLVLDTTQYVLVSPVDTADVLLTASGSSGDFTAYYAEALDSLRRSYHYWNPVERGVAPMSSAVEMRKKVLIYYTGNDTTALPESELDSLNGAVNMGVNLFITGQDFVEKNASSNFVSQVLNLDFGGSTISILCYGVPGDLFGNILFSTIGGTGATNQISRDILLINGPASTPVLEYGSGGNQGIAGVRMENVGSGVKSVLFGFGFEAIDSRSTRQNILQTILGYFDGTIVLGVPDGASSQPLSYRLDQNYPNPFNPKTDVRYEISDVGFVNLVVYDILGREVATLVNEKKSPGRYSVTWDASGQASGVYFYRLTAGDFTETRKLVLLR